MAETSATEKRALRSEDLLALRVITDARISPDGRFVAYVVKRADLEKNGYSSAIYLAATEGGEPRQLTAGTGRDSAPRWSPDGRQLAFISDRGGSAQLYLLSLDGGEARQITDLEFGVGSPAWSPAGDRLAVVSAAGSDTGAVARDLPGGTIRRITRLRYRFDVVGYADDRFGQVWIVPVADGEPWQLTRGAHNHATPAWSPDGQRLAFVANREDEADLGFRSQLYVLPVPASGQAAGADDGAGRLGTGTQSAAVPAWSPDGARIACIGVREGAPAGANTGVYVVADDGSGEVVCPTAGWDRSPGTANFSDTWSTAEVPTPLFWTPDGAAIRFTANDHGRVGLFQATLAGETTLVVGGERTVGFVSASASGDRLAYAAGDMTNPCDLYTSDGAGANERRLTTINGDVLAGLAIQRPESHPFTSFDGRFQVDAWQVRPVGFEQGKEYPLVQIIHGGPHSIFGHVFFFDMQLWANQGWHVLFINPRASQGYGEEFAVANLGDWGGADWREQEQALDAAIARGGVAADRLAVTGLSYGGYMTNWIIGQTDRYCVAASENGICNLISFHTTSDIGWYWTEGEWGKPVWENLDFYLAHSPISQLARIATPTLLLQTETDHRCPIEQGEQFYTALRSRGVPCEMIRFPGDSHTMLSQGKPASRLDRREQTLRWFRRYLDRE
jgi:dipeptidyl aminopeptidase/acylaminoacyl peptidase